MRKKNIAKKHKAEKRKIAEAEKILREQKEVSKKQLILTILFIIASLVAFKIVGTLLKMVIHNQIYRGTVIELFLAVCAIAAAWYLHRLDIFRFIRDGWKEGAWAFGFPITISIFGIYMFLKSGEPILASAFEIAAFMLQLLLIGIAEETLFRGLLQNSLHAYIGEDTLLKRYGVIILTGTLFGMTHLINMLSGVTFASALSQSLAAVPMGILLCGAYYRSGKNLWICILVHALIDMAGLMNGGYLSGLNEAAIVNRSTGFPWEAFCAYLAVDIYVLRPEKMWEK